MGYLRIGKVKQKAVAKKKTVQENKPAPVVYRSIYALANRLDTHSKFIIDAVSGQIKYGGD